MNLSAVEALRHSLIAAQLEDDRELRGLALHRFDLAENAIAALPHEQQLEPHAELLRMLPSDWPLWIEDTRAPSPAHAH